LTFPYFLVVSYSLLMCEYAMCDMRLQAP